jgi:hypothetical protein
LTDPEQGKPDAISLATIMELSEQESGSASEQDAVISHAILRVGQFGQECKVFEMDFVIELVSGAHFGPVVAAEFLTQLRLRSEFTRTRWLIHQHNLLLTAGACLPLFRESVDRPAELPVKEDPVRVVGVVGTAILAHRLIALCAKSGYGNTQLCRPYDKQSALLLM